MSKKITWEEQKERPEVKSLIERYVALIDESKRVDNLLEEIKIERDEMWAKLRKERE
jgi:Mg2+/Co2+ transporter CorC